MMERLSIQEIIDHCDRQLKRERVGSIYHKEHEAVKAYLQELMRYKDMEEQGRLVALPCKVGDRVWRLFSRCFQCEHADDFEAEYCGERDFCGTKIAKEVAFKLIHVDELGKTVFLTREDAERALKGGAN